MRVVFLAAGLLLAAAGNAAQMDITTFNNLRRGMHESEVLARAGEPDRVTFPGGYHVASYLHPGPRVEYHYIPGAGEHDPWLTVVVLTHGKVSALTREKLFSRPAAGPASSHADERAARRDDDIRRERAERTLRAARRYAAVRWQLQERAQQDAPAHRDPPQIHRGTDDEGTPYYGDVAPSPSMTRDPG